MLDAKLVPFDTCGEQFEALRREGHRIVHCHGTFDLLHPGHLKHLEAAKGLGTRLVVSVTSAPYVNKGPGRPVFSDDQRAYQLAHLGIVDFVVVVPKTGAVEIIDRVRPHVYCKGAEYAAPANSTDRRIDEDAAAVARHGGEVAFIGEPLHSSTRLLAGEFDVLEPEVRAFLEKFPVEEALASLDGLLERIRALRVVVVGELIVDRYSYCQVQGLTTKAKVLSVRPVADEDQLGGGLAIARQVASWGCQARYVALAGAEPWLDPLLRTTLQEDAPGLELELLRDPAYQTILKQRYVERPGARVDLQKYFSVNRFLDSPPAGLAARLLEALGRELPAADVVIVCDYGHGVISAEAQELLQTLPRFLALGVQTNSSNFGFNLITKYRRCDLFSLDEPELALAFGERRSSHGDRLGRLSRALSARAGWLTLGSLGSIVYAAEQGQLHASPAMTRRTVDTVGAGDAFFVPAALCGAVGVEPRLTGVLANIAGALATSWPGNRDIVTAQAVVKNVRYFLRSAVRR